MTAADGRPAPSGRWLALTDHFGPGHDLEDVVYGKDEETAAQRFRSRYMLPQAATVAVEALGWDA